MRQNGTSPGREAAVESLREVSADQTSLDTGGWCLAPLLP